VTDAAICPSTTNEQTSFSQCASKYTTSTDLSNCGSTYTIGDSVLTDLEVDRMDYAVSRETYTVNPNTSCLVKIRTNFQQNADQIGSFVFFPPNDNMNYMITKNAWTTSETSLRSAGFSQVNQTSFGAIPVKSAEVINLLIINPSAESQEIQLAYQEAVTVLIQSATVFSLAALSYLI
jgi:hypothetical protein